MRYFLIDRVTSLTLNEKATGIKCVTLTDEVLHDHFPDHPILPGAMIIEGLAQLTGFLLEMSLNEKREEEPLRGILIQVDKIKFYDLTIPGDTLEYQSVIESIIDGAARVAVSATCNGKTRVTGKITFQMAPMPSENVNKQRTQIYKIWTRGLLNCPPIK